MTVKVRRENPFFSFDLEMSGKFPLSNEPGDLVKGLINFVVGSYIHNKMSLITSFMTQRFQIRVQYVIHASNIILNIQKNCSTSVLAFFYLFNNIILKKKPMPVNI